MKKFEELEFTDDFMFSRVMFEEPEICRELLEMILQRKISKVSPVETQRSMEIRSDTKGIRLDVYAEEPKKAVFNLEMQVYREPALPKRTRFYHSTLAVGQLGPGSEYRKLRETYVIFICKNGIGDGIELPFYHFEMEMGKQHFRNDGIYSELPEICERMRTDGQKSLFVVHRNSLGEMQSIGMKDGVHTIFLNACGDTGLVSGGLASFLRYVRNSENLPERREGTASIEERIQRTVERIRNEKVARSDYMTLEMRLCDEQLRARRKTLDAMSELYNALERANRLNEFPEALAEEETRETLLKEFGITLELDD